MFSISKEALQRLREEYTEGSRVELTKMDDPFRTDLVPGTRGTVMFVDDSGAIHVRWDCHSSLAVQYGIDACRKLDAVTITCYGETKVWQRGFYDHVIRNQNDYEQIANYIYLNPTRWQADKLYREE